MKPDGDCARVVALALEMVLEIGFDITGLPSSEGAGDITLLAAPGLTEVCLLCAARASARSFWMTSLLAFSSTGRFLNENDPKSSIATGSLRRLDLRSRT